MNAFGSRLLLLFLLLVSTTILPAYGEPASRTKAVSEAGFQERSILEPRFIGPAPVPLRAQLTSSLELAVERLQTVSSCRELFAPYLRTPGRGEGHDQAAVEHLTTSRYRSDNDATEARICRQRGAAAFTVQSSRVTYVCSQAFGRLGRSRGAAILIHEALHQAGLGEKPLDPEAQTSKEIDRMVRRSCAL